MAIESTLKYDRSKLTFVSRVAGVAMAGALVLGACSNSNNASPSGDKTPATQAETDATETVNTTGDDPNQLSAVAEPTTPNSKAMTVAELEEMKALFDDEAYFGGQVAPRLVKWIDPEHYMFIQFEQSDTAAAEELRYMGIGTKGVFCAQDQPDPGPQGGSFTHFHRAEVEVYADGHAGAPGAEGYWMTFFAVRDFEGPAGPVEPGVDYGVSPTPPPACDAETELESLRDFEIPGAKTLSKEDLDELIAFFDDDLYGGEQVVKRRFKSVSETSSVFFQLDDGDPAEATTIDLLGVQVPGVFCDAGRPSPDFTHYHRYDVDDYGGGHAGPVGETNGYWLAFMATHDFELLGKDQSPGQGRQMVAGIDRELGYTGTEPC